LIITDHHQPRETIPDAVAIVHPLVGGTYPNPHLCGAGVAFKLAWAIAQQMTGADRVSDTYRQFLIDALALAALGTVADVVPLLGENRVITRCGLAMLQASPLPGVQALLEVAGLKGADIDGTAVGFQIAPRINAAGRMGHARLAIELFTRADENRAREIALYLDDHNRSRQTLQRKYAKEAREMIERAGLDGDAQRAIVVASKEWHAGVVGIVAARIVDRYHKPAVVIALADGIGQGSARSVPYFELHKALANCGEHVLSYGGHAMAAGLKIAEAAIPAFTAAFTREANNAMSGSAIRPKLSIDGEVNLCSLDERTVTAIRHLGPFGEGNPKPLLATDWVDLADEPRPVGRTSEHLQISLRHNGTVLKGIAFGAAAMAESLKEHRRCRIAFEPIINEFNGRRRVELQVADFKFPGDV
jgi:single-stranded-DNA-specific exonuclease